MAVPTCFLSGYLILLFSEVLIAEWEIEPPQNDSTSDSIVILSFVNQSYTDP